MKMLHMMHAQEDLYYTRKIEARAEERQHELMLEWMKLDLERQSQDAQRNNMMIMMLISVMGKKISPEDMYDGKYNFSPEQEPTEKDTR